MTQSSNSSPKIRSPSPRPTATKLFITNLDGKSDTKQLEVQLRTLFQKCGVVDNLVVKRNRNAEYCFAFAEMREHSAAQECIKIYDKSSLGGKPIKVEFQDDGKRRKDSKFGGQERGGSNRGCFNCGKMGHFARECHSQRGRSHSISENSRRRSRSRSTERRHKRSRRSDSDRSRSKSKGKKDRKHKGKDRGEKKKKQKRSRSSS